LDAENNPSKAITAIQDAADAARIALTLDPNEPNARLAEMQLQQASLDLGQTEDRLRQILATDPTNIRAMRVFWSLLQCVGRSREALSIIDRALAVKPLAAANNYPRAQLLWILGRNAEADRVIDRAMQFWPEHRYVRFARFIIFAFTQRPRAALAMLDAKDTAPQGFSPAAISLWRLSLPALEERSPAARAAAVEANLEAGKRDERLASQAVMTLSALGDADAAFEVVDSLFVVSNATTRGRSVEPPVKSTAWRFAPWLFIPPTALLRADQRFNSLCDAIGLTEYWTKRRITPDYRLGIY
jgi:tetratricopeptide (TPR) repeat protein